MSVESETSKILTVELVQKVHTRAGLKFCPSFGPPRTATCQNKKNRIITKLRRNIFPVLFSGGNIEEGNNY